MTEHMAHLYLPDVDGRLLITRLEASETDAQLYAKALLQTQYAAMHGQFVPRAMSEEYLLSLVNPYDPQHQQAKQREIGRQSENDVMLVAEIVVPEAHVCVIAGFCSATRLEAAHTPAMLNINEIAIIPPEQDKGIGSILLLAALGEFDQDLPVTLDAQECNRAVSWYRQLGFVDRNHPDAAYDPSACYTEATDYYFRAASSQAVRAAVLTQKPQLQPLFDAV